MELNYIKMKIKNFFSFIFFILSITIIIFYIIKNYNTITTILSTLNKKYLFLLCITTILSPIPNIFIHKILFNSLNLNLKFKEYFPLIINASFFNAVTPFRGGMLYKTIYLKKKYNFTYKNSIVLNIAIYNIAFLIIAFIGLLNLLFLYYFNSVNFYPIYTTFILFYSIIFVIMIFVIFIPSLNKEIKTKNFIIKKIIPILKDISNSWNFLRKNKKYIRLIFLSNFISFIILTLQVYFSYKIINIDVKIYQSIFLVTIISLSTFISITPGNIGITEALLVISSKLFKITSLNSFIAGLLIRFTMFILISTLFIFTYPYLHLRNKKR